MLSPLVMWLFSWGSTDLSILSHGSNPLPTKSKTQSELQIFYLIVKELVPLSGLNLYAVEQYSGTITGCDRHASRNALTSLKNFAFTFRVN